MRFLHSLLAFCMLFAWSAPSVADSGRLLYEANPQLLGSAGDFLDALEKPQLVERYYQRCLKSGSSAVLKNYNDWQCACAASKISSFMDREALVKFFDPRFRRNAEQGRAMYVGYIPCLRTTVNNFVYDTCTAGEALCACIAGRTGDYAYGMADRIIPGFVRGAYVPADAPQDPLAYFLASDHVVRESGNITRFCVNKLN